MRCNTEETVDKCLKDERSQGGKESEACEEGVPLN